MTNKLIARAVERFTAPPDIVPPRCAVCREPMVIDLFGFGFPGMPKRHWIWRHPATGCGLEDNSCVHHGESND